NAQDLGRLRHRQAGEMAELDQLGRLRVLRGQSSERVVEGQQVVVDRGGGESVEVEGCPRLTAAALLSFSPAGVIHQDAAHRLGGGGVEKAAAVTSRVR